MTTDPNASTPLLTFRWGEELYAIPLMAVREVARPARITPVPGASTALIGATVLHGDILPVADVRAMLGLPSNPERFHDGCVIVVRERSIQGGLGEPVGLLVDAIHEVWHMPDSAFMDRTGTALGERNSLPAHLLTGQVQAQDGSWVKVLDVPQVLDAL